MPICLASLLVDNAGLDPAWIGAALIPVLTLPAARGDAGPRVGG